MDVKLEKVEPNWKPRKVVINIESQREYDVLKELSATNVSVPNAVYGEKGYYAAAYKRSERVEILYNFLLNLHEQLKDG